MAASTEEDIRKLSLIYLWKSAGEPNGNPDEFSYQAEKEIIKENAELDGAAWHDRQSSRLSISDRRQAAHRVRLEGLMTSPKRSPSKRPRFARRRQSTS